MIDLEQRRTGIGGSDVAAILGLSPWATPYDIWAQKTGQAEAAEPESEPMRWGNLLEPVIREEAGRRIVALEPDAVVSGPQFLRHATEDWMLANIDGTVDTSSGRAVLECKNVGTFAAGEWGEQLTDQIPDMYLCQVAWYCAVGGFSRAYAAPLVGGNSLRLYHIARDEAVERVLVDRVGEFWHRHVLTGTPPPSANIEDSNKRWRSETRGKRVQATASICEAISEYRRLKADIKASEAMIKRIQFDLAEHIRDGEALVDEAGKELLTYKLQKRAAYQVQASEFRVMRIKEKQ